MRARSVIAMLLVGLPAASPGAQQRPPLTPADADAIAQLLMLEDQRRFDEPTLARQLSAPHPEVKRRAILAVAHINDRRGLPLLRGLPLTGDTTVAATVVFAIGHLRDSSTVALFDSLLSSPAAPPTVATEAAIALGKIRNASARAALVKYLSAVRETRANAATIGEALLSMGRIVTRGDLAPIVRWTSSNNEEIRWRATWALFRPRDPASVAALGGLSRDRSAPVRSWAVRGLTRPQADSAGRGAIAEEQVIAALRDRDRTVRTEAMRALATYDDARAVELMTMGLDDRDTWISVSAAEGLGRARAQASLPALRRATDAGKPCALRIVAMQSLQTFSPSDALDAARRIVQDTVPYCRTTAAQTLTRALSRTGADALSPELARVVSGVVSAFRDARRRELGDADPLGRIGAMRVLAIVGDSSDLARIREAAQSPGQSMAAVANVATSLVPGMERRLAPPDSTAGRGGRGGGRGGARTAVNRPIDDYRAIVGKWIVPDYEGKPRPHAEWDTPRGVIEIELFPGDAPLAVDDFVQMTTRGIVAGTEFTRVVPDFVNQQQTIRAGGTLRDEVNRRGLTRANVSWATAGLDTGAPGYTLGHTAQPHNEGDFTSIGRVVRGLEAMDRIELGDRVLRARMK